MEFKKFLIFVYSPYSQEGGMLDLLMTVDEFPYIDMLDLVSNAYDKGDEPFVQVLNTETGKLNENNLDNDDNWSKEDNIRYNLRLIQDLFTSRGYSRVSDIEDIMSINKKNFLGEKTN